MSKSILINEFQRITNDSPELTESEKQAIIILFQEAENQQEASLYAQSLVEAHYKLIIKVASSARKEFDKVDIRDLIQNGIIGFMEGMKCYDIEKKAGSKVTSYLFLWVREYINREIKFCYSEVKVPEWQLRLARAIDNEVAINKTDIVEAVKRISEKTGTSVDKINKVLMNKVSLSSISKPIESDSFSQSLESFIPDQIEYQPDEMLAINENMAHLNKTLMNVLNERERFSIIHNFGLWGNDKMTLEQIGNELNITKMAVCHIVQKSLKKLRKVKELANE